MIRLERDGIVMEVCNEIQASAFLKNGYSKIGEKEVKNDTVVKAEEEKKYSKSEIMRMSSADLKALAPTVGIEVSDDATGKMLKEQIIGKLGL